MNLTYLQILSIFCFFLLLSSILKLYLIKRQSIVLNANREQVPVNFINRIDLASHQKAIDYNLEKLALGQYTLVFESLLIILFTILGGLNLLAFMAKGLTPNPLLQDFVLILLFLFLNYLLSLPLTIYATFKIEAEFGFNKTTVKTFVLDQVKAILLALCLFSPLLLLILYVMGKMGQYWWLYTWLIWLSFSLILMWVFPKWIAPIFNKFSPLDDISLRARIENLLNRTGFTSNGIFVMDGSKRSGHGNAYFTGFGKNKRIVFFDTLLEEMNPAEIEAVLAHELGHFKYKHIIKQLLVTFVLALAVLFILGQLINYSNFYIGLGILPENISNGMGLILFFLVLPLFTFVFAPLASLLSRKNEYQADRFATEVTSAKDLINALVKLYSSNAAAIVTDKWYSFYYDSHPNAEDRIQALELLQK